MIKHIPFLFALLAITSIWAKPKVGGDIPSGIPEELQMAPVSADTTAKHHLSTPPTPWNFFLGRFRISVEQSPAKDCRQNLFKDEYSNALADTTIRKLERAPFLLYITPFEMFSVFGKDYSEDPSTLRELYSFQVGFGLRGTSSVALEHHVLLPIVRSGKSQCSFGGYVSTYFFRNGNPYWSTGPMGYAGYLISSKVMLRAGLKHTMFDYLAHKHEDHGYNGRQSFTVEPNAWRMFISLSIGSI